MIEVVEKEEYLKLIKELNFLKEDIKYLKKFVENQFVKTDEAKKITGKTGQRFYDFLAEFEIKKTGVGKSTRYYLPDLNHAMKIEVKRKQNGD